MSADSTLDLIVSSLEFFDKRLNDAVGNSNPFMKKLSSMGQIKKSYGGTSAQSFIDIAANTTVTSNTADGIIDTTSQKILQNPDYAWKRIDGSFKFTTQEKEINAGEARLIDLIEARYKNLQNSIDNEISTQLFGDGTGNGGLDIGGLQLLIADDPTTGTVGGIDRSTNSLWRNQLYSFAAESVTPSSSTIDRAMNDLMLRCTTSASSRPDMIIADANYYSLYRDSLVVNQRFVGESTAMGGFKALDFNGIPVFYDPNCPANHMYFLDSSTFELRYLGNKLINFAETQRPINQLVYVTPVYSDLALVLTNSRGNGTLKA